MHRQADAQIHICRALKASRQRIRRSKAPAFAQTSSFPPESCKKDLDIQSIALSALISNCLGPKSQPLRTASTHHLKRQHRSAGCCKTSG